MITHTHTLQEEEWGKDKEEKEYLVESCFAMNFSFLLFSHV